MEIWNKIGRAAETEGSKIAKLREREKQFVVRKFYGTFITDMFVGTLLSVCYIGVALGLAHLTMIMLQHGQHIPDTILQKRMTTAEYLRVYFTLAAAFAAALVAAHTHLKSFRDSMTKTSNHRIDQAKYISIHGDKILKVLSTIKSTVLEMTEEKRLGDFVGDQNSTIAEFHILELNSNMDPKSTSKLATASEKLEELMIADKTVVLPEILNIQLRLVIQSCNNLTINKDPNDALKLIIQARAATEKAISQIESTVNVTRNMIHV
ncbi:MAG: hypothetical protein Alpg2KO_14460 [Alphaproteobacteria bacterium]